MKHLRRRELLTASAAVIFAGTRARAARAQTPQPDYPSRTVRLVVPFPAGQGADALARIVKDKLSVTWGQPIIVDNRPGAGGTVGAESVAKAEPDGYTLLIGSSGPLGVAPALYPKLRYDPQRDFAPIINLAAVVQTLVVPATSAFQSVQEIIAAAKAAPGRYTYASAGVGSTSHLTMEMLKQMAGIDLLHVPYRGSPEANTDVMTGRVDMMFDASPTVIPHVQSGSMRALGVSTRERLPFLPDVPSISESGFPTFEVLGWIGLVAPASLSRAISQKIHRDLTSVLSDADVRRRIEGIGAIILGGTSKEFDRTIADEIAKWTRVIKAAQIKVE